MVKRFSVVAVSLAMLALAACGNEPTAPQAGQQEAPANTVDVTMEDYSFSAEGEPTAGQLLVNFTNAGEELHHGIIGKLDEGKTLEDVQKFLEKGMQGPPPPWFNDAPIDETIISPGETSGVVLDAEEGTYVLLCFMPDPKGKPHIAHGMVQTFTVEGGGEATAIEPDAQISMTEEGPEAPDISAGTSFVEVTNDAEIPGEVFIIQLAEGKTFDDIDAWFNKGQKGPIPAVFYGGTHAFGPGESVLLSFTLDPGDYSIVATYGEGKDLKDTPTEFTVSE